MYWLRRNAGHPYSAGAGWFRQAEWLAIFIFALSFLSSGFNFLGAAAPISWPKILAPPEDIVRSALGGGQSLLIIQTSEGLVPYTSSASGQMLFYQALLAIPGVEVASLTWINSAFQALVVALITYFIARRVFGFLGGLAFGVYASLAPLMIGAGLSLYWMMWLSLVPLLLSLWLGPRAMVDGRVLLLLLGLATLVLFLRFLCGYEFASAVAIWGAAPLVFFGLRQRVKAARLFSAVAGMACAAVVAFAAATVVHAARVGDDIASGYETIAIALDKRTGALGASSETLVKACGVADKHCQDNLARTLEVSRATVLALYFTFRRTVPWAGGSDLITSDGVIGEMRGYLATGRFAEAQQVFATYPSEAFGAIAGPLVSAGVVWSLILLAAWRLLRARRDGLPALGILIFAAGGALSWFMLAKGHAYAEPAICPILWTPFVGFLAALAVDRRLGWGGDFGLAPGDGRLVERSAAGYATNDAASTSAQRKPKNTMQDRIGLIGSMGFVGGALAGRLDITPLIGLSDYLEI